MKQYILLAFSILSLQSFSQSKNFRLLGNWNDTTIPTNAGGFTYNEVFGFEMKGVEYAVLGSTQGTHIIDITNPTNLIEVDFVPGQYRGNVTHRDFDVRNGYLYMVCDQANSSLQIADLSFLPDSVSVVYDSRNLLVRSHNIFIDSANDLLYSCGGNTQIGTNELRIIDISTPTTPTLVADLQNDVVWWSSFVGYVHDIFVRDNIAYTNDENAMHIIDFSNPLSPVILGSISSYMDQGYNHSGYLMDDDTTYVMCDETHGKRTKFMDVSDVTNIQVTDLEGPALPNSTQIPHNPIIKGKYAYVSYYYDGVQVYDISNKFNVKNIGYYDTYQGPNGPGGEGCWGVYPLLASGKILASDRRRGLFVLNHLTPPKVNFDASSTFRSEGDGLQYVGFNLSNELDDTVTVTIDLDTANSTATSGVDYSSSVVFPRTYSFSNGKVRDSIPYFLIDDAAIEGIETLIFTITTVTNGEVGSISKDTVFIQDNEVVGINELNEAQISMFPNPLTKGEFLYFTKKVSSSLFNTSGKLISTQNSNRIDVSDLPKGIYIVHYANKSEKLVIQ